MPAIGVVRSLGKGRLAEFFVHYCLMFPDVFFHFFFLREKIYKYSSVHTKHCITLHSTVYSIFSVLDTLFSIDYDITVGRSAYIYTICTLCTVYSALSPDTWQYPFILYPLILISILDPQLYPLILGCISPDTRQCPLSLTLNCIP